MTPEQSRWIREAIAAGVKRHDELIAARQPLADWPQGAFADPPALLVYATESMFAYYLGPEGQVYQLDLDRFIPELDEIGAPDFIRETYAKAAERYPMLAGL